MNKLILLLKHVSFIYDTLEKVRSFLSFKNLEIFNRSLLCILIIAIHFIVVNHSSIECLQMVQSIYLITLLLF